MRTSNVARWRTVGHRALATHPTGQSRPVAAAAMRTSSAQTPHTTHPNPTSDLGPVCADAGRVVVQPACKNVRGPGTPKRSRPHPHHKTVRARSGTGTRPAHSRQAEQQRGGGKPERGTLPLSEPQGSPLRFPPAPPSCSPLQAHPQGRRHRSARHRQHTWHRPSHTGRPTPGPSKQQTPRVGSRFGSLDWVDTVTSRFAVRE